MGHDEAMAESAPPIRASRVGDRSSSAPERARILGLSPHPEGGWYRETWRSAAVLDTGDGRGRRSAATMILFLLAAGDSSAWHRVASDEIWLWHGLGVLTIELGGAGGSPIPEEQVVLGPDAAANERVQVLVPAGTWQRTIPAPDDVLVSCLVSPGFDFADFTLAGEIRGPEPDSVTEER